VEHVRAELAAAPSPAARVAILEDELHHHRDHWPAEVRDGRAQATLRPAADPSLVRLSLPLTATMFDRGAPADTWYTRP
jgi:hypothetical protein